MQKFVLLILLMPVWVSACNAQSVVTNADGVAPRPVKRLHASSAGTKDIDFFDFEFQRPYLGHEGPNFTPIDEEPSAGARYLVVVELFMQEAIATAKFELIENGNGAVRLLRLSKSDTSPTDGDYVGIVEVPSEPFRIAVSGKDVNGEPYRKVYKRLFQPTTTPPAPPLLPPGLPPAEVQKMTAALAAFEQQAMANVLKAASNHPDGVIVMPRVLISKVTYEPLLSDKGNQLGMRLNYEVQFSADGDYAHSFHVFPMYDDVDLRGLVSMDIVNEKIDPMPEPPSYATPQIHVDLSTLVKDGAMAQFKGGVAYHFTVDFVPDFVGQNATKSKFCVDEEHYKNKGTQQRVWEAMKANQSLVKYRISSDKLDYAGETKQFSSPKTFYDGFLKEGTVKCKPYKNSYF